MSITRSLTRPVTSSLTRSITKAQRAGGGADPLLTAALALSPVWLYDHKDLASFFSDAAMTTPAAVDGPVGAVLDKSGNGFHRTQSTAGSRPTLRQAGALYYLEYDGTADFLVTGSVDLTATNVLTLCMGARKITGNSNALLVENSTISPSNDGTIRLSANGGSLENWEFGLRGTTTSGNFRYVVAGSSTNVVTSIGELVVSGGALLSDQLQARIDAVAGTVIGASTTGGVNFGNYPFYFGARGGASARFSGRDYGGALYAAKAAGTDLAAIEAFVADRTGVTL